MNLNVVMTSNIEIFIVVIHDKELATVDSLLIAFDYLCAIDQFVFHLEVQLVIFFY